MAVHARPRQILELLHKQGFKCAYTGDPLTPEDVSGDHIVPASMGGSHDIGNIALVRRSVNHAKGTQTIDEFREMCQKVVNHLGFVAVQERPIGPELISGCSDPVEILTRLGYPSVADNVREKLNKLDRMLKYRTRVGWSVDGSVNHIDEKIQIKQRKLAEVNAELQRKRVLLSQTRAALRVKDMEINQDAA